MSALAKGSPAGPRPERASAADLTADMAEKVMQTLQEKVEHIQNVTRRTKILAINASIESARAGAAGKGFAIISDEVRAISLQIEQLSEQLRNELVAQIGELKRSTGELVVATAESA